MPTDARTPVPWSGRALRGLSWSAGGGAGTGGGGLVVAVHGITANAAAWAAVAPRVLRGRAVAEVVAPELRGRGASRHLPGPWGLARHADDVAAEVTALLDARAAARPDRRVVLVGHSMGAFVLAALATRHPALLARVAAVVLVDGGLPLEAPPGTEPQEAAASALGPALARLHPVFADPAEHRALWQRHPALPPEWDAAVESYVARDLAPVDVDADAGSPGATGWRVPVSADAVAQDMTDLYDPGLVLPGLELLAARRAVLLTAPRGLDDGAPLYPDAPLRRWRERLPGLRVREVPDVNHYTVLFATAAAGAVAATVLTPLAQEV